MLSYVIQVFQDNMTTQDQYQLLADFLHTNCKDESKKYIFFLKNFFILKLG